MNVPAQHLPFLQPERSPEARDGGLHAVLHACFPVDGRVDGCGALLDYGTYDLVLVDSYLSLRVTLRLSWWSVERIENIVEQPLGFLSFVPDDGRPYPSLLVALDRTAEELSEHVTSIVLDRKARAQATIAGATPDTIPADLIFEPA